MDLKLELVLIPVADVDRAKAFYTEKAGFHLDVDHRAGDDFRVVQMTPPGSSCSISVGVGITNAEPGSVRGIHLVVTDIEAAHRELVDRGVQVSDIRYLGPNGWTAGADPNHQDYQSFADFSDPDGNTWILVLEQTATTDAMRAADRNGVAWAALMSGEQSLRAEALELARAAHDLEPDRAAYAGTYAFALLENGSPREAAALLDPIAPSHPRPRDRASDLCLLAICRARLHEPDVAAQHLQAAEAADPRCSLLERARAEIAQSTAVAIT